MFCFLALGFGLCPPARAKVVSSTASRCALALLQLSRRLSANDFPFTRTLSGYSNALGIDLPFILDHLHGNQVWIDSGAGGAIAIADFHLRAEKRGIPSNQTPGTIAIGIKKPSLLNLVEDGNRSEGDNYYAERDAKLEQMEKQGRHRYIESAVDKIKPEDLPKAALITDLFGPLSYSDSPEEVLKWYMEVLAPNGRIFVGMDRRYAQVRIYKKAEQMNWWDRFLLRRAGIRPVFKMNFIEWLQKRVKGIKVEIRQKNGAETSIEIVRTGEPLEIPELHLLKLRDFSPPDRIFVEPEG